MSCLREKFKYAVFSQEFFTTSKIIEILDVYQELM